LELTPEFPALQYVGELERGGEAGKKGVKAEDFILEVSIGIVLYFPWFITSY